MMISSLRKTLVITSSSIPKATNCSNINNIKYVNRSFSAFYNAYLQPNGEVTKSIKGEIIDNAVDITNIRPGERIEIPYEVTVSNSFRDFWQSAFYSHDRINTSTPFSRELGFQDQVIPFGLMLFLAGSMSHADHAKVQVGFSNAHYYWPAYAGDTFKKSFIIRSLRSTSTKRHSVFTIDCELVNQRGTKVFACEKTMLFPFEVPASDIVLPREEHVKQDFLDHLIKRADTLQKIGSQTLTVLRPGQLIFHTLSRPLSTTQMMQLASLARLTHERHFNTRLYRREEMFVPGGLILGLATAMASRDLHEVLYEELIDCNFSNNFNPGDTMSAMTFIKSVDEHISGDIEAVTIRSFGVKNLDVARTLGEVDLPIELFTTPLKNWKPAAMEELLKKTCPELCKLIVCISDRKIYRQAPKKVPFLL